MERPRQLRLPLAVLLLLGVSALVGPLSAVPLHGPHADPEVDGEESRKVLGSSVVTSVSVIMDLGDGTKAYLADAVGRPLRPASGSPPPGSPAALVSPDRYEFYTFDEHGDLVRRRMTLAQIQGLLAAGGHPLRLRLRPQPAHKHHGQPPALLSADEDAGAGQDSDDVRHVVASVQSVLRGALDKVSGGSAQKPQSTAAPTAAPAAPSSSSTRRPAPSRRPPARPQYRPTSPRPAAQTRRPPLRPAASTVKPVVSTANSIASTAKPTRRPPPHRWTTAPTTAASRTTTPAAQLATTTAPSSTAAAITGPTTVQTTAKPSTATPPKPSTTAASTRKPTTAATVTSTKPTFFRKPGTNATTTSTTTTTITTTTTTTTPSTTKTPTTTTTTTPAPTTTTPTTTTPTPTTTTSTTTTPTTTTSTTTTPEPTATTTTTTPIPTTTTSQPTTTTTTTSTTTPATTTTTTTTTPATTTTTTTTTELITAAATTANPTATTTSEQQSLPSESVQVEQTLNKLSVPPAFVEITPRPATRPPTSTAASTTTTVKDTSPTQELPASSTAATPLSTFEWPADEENASGTVTQNSEPTTATTAATVSSHKPPASPEPSAESVSLSAPSQATHKPVYVPLPGETPLDVSFTALPLDASTQKGQTEAEDASITTGYPETIPTEASSPVSDIRNESASDSLLPKPDSDPGVPEDVPDVSPSTEPSTQFISTNQPSLLTAANEVNASQMTSPAPSRTPDDDLSDANIALDAPQPLNVVSESTDSPVAPVDSPTAEKVADKPLGTATDNDNLSMNAAVTQLSDLEKYGTQNTSTAVPFVQEAASVPEKSTAVAQGTTEVETSMASDDVAPTDTTEKLSDSSSDAVTSLSAEKVDAEVDEGQSQKSPESTDKQKPSSEANVMDSGSENSSIITVTERPEELESSTEKDVVGTQDVIIGDMATNVDAPIPEDLLDSLSSVLSQVSDTEKVTEIYDKKPGDISDFSGLESSDVDVKDTSNASVIVSNTDLGTIIPEASFNESMPDKSSIGDHLQDVSTLTSVIVGSTSTTQSTLVVDGTNVGQKDDEIVVKPEPTSETIKNVAPESGSVSEEKWEMVSHSVPQQEAGDQVEVKHKVSNSSVSEPLASDVSEPGIQNETITNTDTVSPESTVTTAESSDADSENFVTPHASDYEMPLSEIEGAIATSADAPPFDISVPTDDASASEEATEYKETVTTRVHVVDVSEDNGTTSRVPPEDSDKPEDSESSEQVEGTGAQDNFTGPENGSEELLSDGSSSGASVKVQAEPEEEAAMTADSSYTAKPESDSDGAEDVKNVAAESGDQTATTPGPETFIAEAEFKPDQTKNKPLVTVVKAPEQDTITMEMETTYSSGLKGEAFSGIPVDTGDIIVSKIDSSATFGTQNDELLQDPVTEAQKLKGVPDTSSSGMGSDFTDKEDATADPLSSDDPGKGAPESVSATKISVVTATSSSVESIKDSVTVSQEQRIPGEGLGTGETSVHVLSDQVPETLPILSLQKLGEIPSATSNGDSSISSVNDENGSKTSSSDDVESTTTIVGDSKISLPPSESDTVRDEFTVTPLPAYTATEMKPSQETTTPSEELGSSAVRITPTSGDSIQPSGTAVETVQPLKEATTEDAAVDNETNLSQQAANDDSMKDGSSETETEEINPSINDPAVVSTTEEVATTTVPDISLSSSNPDRVSATNGNDSVANLPELVAENQEQNTVKSTKLENDASGTPGASVGSGVVPEEDSAATMSDSGTLKDKVVSDFSDGNIETPGMNEAASEEAVTAPNASDENIDKNAPEETTAADTGSDELQASSSSNSLPATVFEHDVSDSKEDGDIPENSTPTVESAESLLKEESNDQETGPVGTASTESTPTVFDKETQVATTNISNASEALHSSEAVNVQSTPDSPNFQSTSDSQPVKEEEDAAGKDSEEDDESSLEEKIAAKLAEEALSGASASGISAEKDDELGEDENNDNKYVAPGGGNLQPTDGSAPGLDEEQEKLPSGAHLKGAATDDEEPVFVKIHTLPAVNGAADSPAASEMDQIPVLYHSAVDMPTRIHGVVPTTSMSSGEAEDTPMQNEKPGLGMDTPNREVPTEASDGDGAESGVPVTEDVLSGSGSQSQTQPAEGATSSTEGTAQPPVVSSTSPSTVAESVTAQPVVVTQSSSPAGGLLPPEESWPEAAGQGEEPERPPVDLRPAGPAHQLGLEATTAALDGDVRAFAALLNELALRLWAGVAARGLTAASQPPRSLVLSPFALTSLLAMVFLGARGPTSDQMNDLLRLDDVVTFNPHLVLRNVTDSLVHGNPPGVAAVAFVRQLYSDKSKGRLLDFYKERAQQWYEGHVEEADWQSVGDLVRRRTNLLVRRQTRGRVAEFVRGAGLALRPPLAAFTASVFQTDCSGASTEGRDGEMYFTVSPSPRQRRLVPVPAAVWSEGVHAGYDPHMDATIAAIGAETLVSVVLALPGQQGQVAPGDGLSALERRLLTPEGWARALRCVAPRRGLQLQAPRFAHRSLLNATAALRRLGLRDLLTPGRADLRGLSGGLADLHLADVLAATQLSTCAGHSAHAEVFPQRAAGRARRLDYDDRDDEVLQLPLALRPRQARRPAAAARLSFNRPFFYAVRHNPTGIILHMGRFNPRLIH